MRIRPKQINHSLVVEYLARATTWCEESLARLAWTDFDLTVFLGGSIAKGVADRSSDLDLCVIVGSENEQAELPLGPLFPEAFWSVNEFSGRMETLSIDAGLTADVHVVTQRTCQNLIESFYLGRDISNRTQDLLWTLNRGYTCFVRGIEVRYRISYPRSVQLQVLRKFLPALGLHDLDKAFSRGDHLQIDESKNTIRKCLLCLGYAYRGELFWGFKSTQRIYWCLPRSIRLALHHLDEIDQTNWIDKIRIIKSLIQLTRHWLNNLLEGRDAAV